MEELKPEEDFCEKRDKFIQDLLETDRDSIIDPVVEKVWKDKTDEFLQKPRVASEIVETLKDSKAEITR